MSARKEATGEVVKLNPPVLRDRDAALYLGGKSASWLRAKRQADIKAKKAGLAMTGPAWVCIGASVLYRVTELDRWLAENSTERGQISFSNRGHAPEAKPRDDA